MYIFRDFAKNINNGLIAICPNYSKRDGQIIEKPFLYFDASRDPTRLDCNFIHELNHLLECNTISVDSEGYTLICGWDIVQEGPQKDDNLDFYEKERAKRNYEVLNEVINEFIAQDICKIMHENGITLSNDLEKSENYGGTLEDISLRRFTRGFYEEFKKEIIASRTGDMSQLLDGVGKNNFEEFNNMLRDYYNRFNEGELYKLYNDLHDNVDNENTRYHKACVEKTIELLNRFRQHRDNVRIAK